MVAPTVNIAPMNIPQWLRGMLESKRYRSTYEMSMKWGIPEPTIYRWLSGQRSPSVSYCIKLAEATGTPLEEVVRMAGLAA